MSSVMMSLFRATILMVKSSSPWQSTEIESSKRSKVPKPSQVPIFAGGPCVPWFGGMGLVGSPSYYEPCRGLTCITTGEKGGDGTESLVQVEEKIGRESGTEKRELKKGLGVTCGQFEIR